MLALFLLNQHCSAPTGPSPASSRSPHWEEEQTSPSIRSQPAQALQEDMLGFIPPRTVKLDKFLGQGQEQGYVTTAPSGLLCRGPQQLSPLKKPWTPAAFTAFCSSGVCIPSHPLPEHLLPFLFCPPEPGTCPGSSLSLVAVRIEFKAPTAEPAMCTCSGLPLQL